MKNVFLFLLPLFALFACSPRSSWDFVQLDYEVSAADKSTEELVHRYWGSGFTLRKDTSGAILRREASDRLVEFRMNPNSLIYREVDEDGNCSFTELKGRHFQIMSDAKVSDSLVFLKNRRKIGPFKAHGVLVYNNDLGNDPAELWYTAEIPPYWPYSSDIPGMMLEYHYLLDGKKVSYTLRDVSETHPAALQWAEPPCSWIFPEVFLVNPEVGTIDVDDYNLYGLIVKEDSDIAISYSSVEVFRNDSLYYSTYADSSGYFNFYLPLRGIYEFRVSGGENYVPKSVIFDMNLPSTVNVSGGFATELKMSLFESEDERVREFLESIPMGKAGYNPVSDNFEFDFEYTRQVQEELKLLREKE